MKNSVLMRSINTLYFRQNNSLILKLTCGQRKRSLKHARFFEHDDAAGVFEIEQVF
jgi:hypothetical protein